MVKKKLDENNRLILEDLKKTLPGITKLTCIELGILLLELDLAIDWASLGDAHDYLGKYENEERDRELKRAMDEANRSPDHYKKMLKLTVEIQQRAKHE